MASTSSQSRQTVRRRASRAAGPANGSPAETTTVRADTPAAAKTSPARTAVKLGPPPRRPAHQRRVAIAALALGFVAAAPAAAAVAVMVVQQKQVEATQARNQRFVDTATQTVVNMFSFKQDNINDSVNRFYDGTSGPLRDMLSQNKNVENLKAMFRDTKGNSEAVINGAALEDIDGVSKNSSVLVSARVTVSDIDGNNKPTQPYRMRVIVHEDDNGRMTAYDLKYPDGGN